jgi:hypothetical protein
VVIDEICDVGDLDAVSAMTDATRNWVGLCA